MSDTDIIKRKIIDTLLGIYDPEIPVNIWELGLIYQVDVNENGDAEIVMTLTAPNCPVAESLPLEVKNKVEALEDVENVNVTITFDPPWSMERMSDAAKLELGLL